MKADGWNAIATIMLVVVGIWGIFATENSLELSERAWLGSSGSMVSLQPTAAQPLHYVLLFMNSGKEPALDLNFAQDSGSIEVPPNDDLANAVTRDNVTCDNLMPLKGGGVVLPGAGLQRGIDTGRGAHPIFVNDDVLKGRHYIYTQGCVAYRSFGRVHHTSFCFLYQIKPLPTPAAMPPQTSGAVPPLQVNPTPNVGNGDGTTSAVTGVSNCPTGSEAD